MQRKEESRLRWSFLGEKEGSWSSMGGGGDGCYRRGGSGCGTYEEGRGWSGVWFGCEDERVRVAVFVFLGECVGVFFFLFKGKINFKMVAEPRRRVVIATKV